MNCSLWSLTYPLRISETLQLYPREAHPMVSQQQGEKRRGNEWLQGPEGDTSLLHLTFSAVYFVTNIDK